MPMNLWAQDRQSPGKTAGEDDHSGHRTLFEQDYDRILFSSAVRRLSDKTQVFPLDTNDSVRTRLTHSHEVANLAKSIGLRASVECEDIFQGEDFHRIVAPLLGACGLAHDLGNPPFGHQGEAAISKWFEDKQTWIFDRKSSVQGADHVDPVENDYRPEFTRFDGNPQSLRLLTRLQTSKGEVGLDLCAATILTSMKYPVGANGTDSKHPAKKKYGYFCSEKHVVDWAREKTGLAEGQRHPLAWLIEAADDTAYSVLDVEDSMKKGILSPDDLLTILDADSEAKKSPSIGKLEEKFRETDQLDRAPSVRRDIKIGYARSFLIEDLVTHATTAFVNDREAIWSFAHDGALMDSSALCSALKVVARQYAFGNPEVLFIEAQGRHAIESLLDALWHSIVDRKKDALDSPRQAAKNRYVHSLISPNYIEASLEGKCDHSVANRLRFRELRLLTDMVAGMTDQFALDLAAKIGQLQ